MYRHSTDRTRRPRLFRQVLRDLRGRPSTSTFSRASTSSLCGTSPSALVFTKQKREVCHPIPFQQGTGTTASQPSPFTHPRPLTPIQAQAQCRHFCSWRSDPGQPKIDRHITDGLKREGRHFIKSSDCFPAGAWRTRRVWQSAATTSHSKKMTWCTLHLLTAITVVSASSETPVRRHRGLNNAKYVARSH